MAPYPIYATLIRELFGDDESVIQSRLYGLRPYVSALRSGYKSFPPKVNYADEQQRIAYMIAYYPQDNIRN